MRTTYTGPVKDRGVNAQGKANVSREELEDFKRKYGANKTLRDLLNAELPGAKPLKRVDAAPAGADAGRGMAEGRKASDKDTAPMRASRGPAAPYRDKAAEAKREADTSAMLGRMKDRAARGERVASNEEERERAKGRTLAALGAMPGVGAASKLASAGSKLASVAKSAPKAATRVEPRVGREVTTKLDDAAAAFSRPQARQASKDTGYTREPSKTTPPQPTRAPKPRDEIIKRQAQMREGRKATEDYARDVMERGAEMGMKRGGNVKSYAKGGMTKGGGCETRGKKSRYI
jgi:hypothetical protein